MERDLLWPAKGWLSNKALRGGPVRKISRRSALKVAALVSLPDSAAKANASGDRQRSHPEIWLAGVDTVVRAETGRIPSDYAELFSSLSAWERARADITVFKVSKQFVLRSSAELFARAIDTLRKNSIKLAMESGVVESPGRCGGLGVEGYNTRDHALRSIERIKRFGGRLDYLALDEPWWYGHVFGGHRSCGYSNTVTAAALREEISLFREAFQDLHVADIEPFANQHLPDWPAPLAEWLDAYRKAVGSYPESVHLDMRWEAAWQKPLQLLVPQLQARGIKLGIIYDGDAKQSLAVAWEETALARAREVENALGIRPAQAILQTWMKQPERMLPDATPGTMTNLVLRYAERWNEGPAGVRQGSERARR